MQTRTKRKRPDPDLGVLAARLLFAVQGELFAKLGERGFGDIAPRHGAVLAYLEPDGIRATDLSQRSGQHKQVVGTIVDELEQLGYVQRRPDPADRRAKLVCPTPRGLAQMHAADEIMTRIHRRHARRLGKAAFTQFTSELVNILEHQRRHS